MLTAREGENGRGIWGRRAGAFAVGLSLFKNSASHLCPGPDMFAQASWVNEGLAGPNMAEAAKATGVSPDPVSAVLFFLLLFFFFYMLLPNICSSV